MAVGLICRFQQTVTAPRVCLLVLLADQVLSRRLSSTVESCRDIETAEASRSEPDEVSLHRLSIARENVRPGMDTK